MNIRKLTIDDIALLVKLRIDFLWYESIEYTIDGFEDIKQRSEEFFISALQANNFIAFVAEDNGKILSTAFMTIADRPPRKAFTSYRVGTLYNVLTYIPHRRKGIATQVLTALFNEAKLMGVASVDLLASADGKELYEKLGFWSIANYTPMRKELP